MPSEAEGASAALASRENGDDDDLEWEEWDPKKLSFVNHMIAGSSAGLAEHVTMFPVDTLKTHIQCERCGSMSPLQTWNCATRIVHREGIFRLWRGVSATFAGCLPAHAAYFSIFETTKVMYGANEAGHHPAQAAACGASAALGHDLCMTPFDTVKQRMQLGYYNSVPHCVATVARTEGVLAFYRSMPTTLMMNLPFGCIMVAVNESVKKVLNPTGEYSIPTSMVAGSIAGAVAAALTTPIDLIKTRIQTQNLEPCPTPRIPPPRITVTRTVQRGTAAAVSAPSSSSSPSLAAAAAAAAPAGVGEGTVKLSYRGALQVVRQVITEEGYAAFLRGMAPRMLVHAPAVAISWTTYESMKNLLASGGLVG